jgi:hypothetical protein
MPTTTTNATFVPTKFEIFTIQLQVVPIERRCWQHGLDCGSVVFMEAELLQR